MRCEEIRDQLDDYVDGELSPQADAAVVEHLEGCVACRRRERSLRRLLERAAALPRSLEPRRDLWPEIEARIAAGARRGRFPRPDASGSIRPAGRPIRRLWPAAALAATLAAVVIAGALWWNRGTGSPDPDTDPGTAPPPPGIALATDPGAAATADGDIERARQELRQALEARKASLSPATVEVLERNLRLIDQAIAEIQTALAKDPGNRQLQQLLLAGQRREIELLRTAAFLQET